MPTENKPVVPRADEKPPTVTDRRSIKIPVKQKVNTFAPALKYKIVGDEEINFTKAEAFKFLELRSFDGERPVRERHVQFLFDEYVSGRFLWQNVILASAKLPDGTEYRINGQHTCWMRVNVPERDEPLKAATVRHTAYAVADQHQLRQLYSAFDRGAPRTVAHIGKVILMGTRVVEGVPQSLINAILAGFKVYFSNDRWRRQNTSVEDWCAIIENNHNTNFNIVGRYVATHERETRWIKRASVVAALFATFEKNVQESDNFWGPVIHGLNLEQKTDPRYQLRKYLDTHGQSALGEGLVTSQEEMFCVCVQCWNHWREKTEITQIKPPQERPKVKS